jgi:GNAT superfamily N-acetyltransferase
MSVPDGVSIREMTFSDIRAGVSLCRASRWNQTERDWQHFLVAAPRGALVAVENGSVIGTVATMPYGSFTWISMVLVNPAARGRGVGTLLLERGLSLVDDRVATRLDATPAGEPLYRGLGFVSEYRLTRLFLDARLRGASRPSGARPLTRADWPAVLDKDIHAFGASRASLLERLTADAPEYAWVAERDGRLNGYLLGRHGAVREHLGPLIADSDETAWQLLGACLAAHPDREFIIDVPDDQHSWRARLGELGFAAERPFLRMYRGRLTTPGQPSQVYAITGAEFG